MFAVPPPESTMLDAVMLEPIVVGALSVPPEPDTVVRAVVAPAATAQPRTKKREKFFISPPWEYLVCGVITAPSLSQCQAGSGSKRGAYLELETRKYAPGKWGPEKRTVGGKAQRAWRCE